MPFWPWKGSIGYTFPLASILCGCAPHWWWPAASSSGTSWGSSGTSLLSNFVQKVILEKSLQILIFRTYIFSSFHQVLSKFVCGLRVKVFDCQLFVQITLQNKKFYSHNSEKFVSIILTAGHTHSKNLSALQLKQHFFCPLPTVVQ